LKLNHWWIHKYANYIHLLKLNRGKFILERYNNSFKLIKKIGPYPYKITNTLDVNIKNEIVSIKYSKGGTFLDIPHDDGNSRYVRADLFGLESFNWKGKLIKFAKTNGVLSIKELYSKSDSILKLENAIKEKQND
jgi:hypothetical protein